jgi:hypothetical protein
MKILEIVLSAAALVCPVMALVAVGPILEIKPTYGNDYRKAEYVSCNVQSKAAGPFFCERVSLRYKAPDMPFHELQFLAPLPPFASVKKCEMSLDEKKYKSDVYTKFRGDEMYENAPDTETIAEVVKIGDLIYFRLKVPKDSKVREIAIDIHWQQKPEVMYHAQLPSRRLYVFPRRAMTPVIKQYINNYSEEQGSEYRFDMSFRSSGTSDEKEDDFLGRYSTTSFISVDRTEIHGCSCPSLSAPRGVTRSMHQEATLSMPGG